MDHDLRKTDSQDYSLSLQGEIKRNYVLEVDYVGTKGTRLVGPVDLNASLFVSGASTAANINARRPFQPWGQVSEEAGCFDSNYNSLQTSVTKHSIGGFFLLASYTFSKSIDYTSDS